MANSLIAVTSILGCKWIDIENCKWYQFSRKRKLRKQMLEICKKEGIFKMKVTK